MSQWSGQPSRVAQEGQPPLEEEISQEWQYQEVVIKRMGSGATQTCIPIPFHELKKTTS